MSSILLQYPKNPKVGPNWCALLVFLTSIVAKYQKNEGDQGDPLGIFFSKKFHNEEKTEGDPVLIVKCIHL